MISLRRRPRRGRLPRVDRLSSAHVLMVVVMMVVVMVAIVVMMMVVMVIDVLSKLVSLICCLLGSSRVICFQRGGGVRN
jgi:hypothetical protein